MTSYSMQPSVEGKNGGEQRRKRIFSGNFTEIFKCLLLEYLRRPLKTMKRLNSSAQEINGKHGNHGFCLYIPQKSIPLHKKILCIPITYRFYDFSAFS